MYKTNEKHMFNFIANYTQTAEIPPRYSSWNNYDKYKDNFIRWTIFYAKVFNSTINWIIPSLLFMQRY